MKKLWMLLVSIVLCFVACDMPATGGNPGEGECSYIMKEHGIMTNFIRIICPFDSICDVKFSFGPVAVPDDYGCVAGFEYKFVQENEIKIVKKNYFHSELNQNTSVDLVLDSNKRASISLIDTNNVEKKYDIDLSGIINSYTVRGDSVDVNVMKGCSLSLYECDRETVYGNLILDSRYSFSILEGCKKYYSYDCLWDNQGPFEKDKLDIHAKIYWKE